MALFERKKEEKVKAPYSLYVPSDAKIISEAMKGQTQNLSDNGFNKQSIGEPHPFNYKIVEDISNNFGLIDTFVEKIVNHVWGRGFSTKSTNEKAKKIIDQWIEDVNFKVIGRQWLTTALKKGTAYLELSGNINEVPQEIKGLNPDRMFIKRNDKGVIVEYRQQKIINGQLSMTEFNSFKPYEVACMVLKKANEDAAYGLGIIYPNLKTIDCYLQNQRDLHTLIKRKANNPMIATLGNKEKDEYPTEAEIAAFGGLMSYMQAKTEWAVGANVALSVLDFGDVGKNFDAVLRNDFELLMFGFQTPEALLGQGDVAEGLGNVQMDGYDRYAAAIQNSAEADIENQIFTRVLRANGIDDKVQFIWGEPSKGELNTKISNITTLLSNMSISYGLRKELEMQLATLLGIETSKLTDPTEVAALTMDQSQPKIPRKETYEGYVHIGRVSTNSKIKLSSSHEH